MTRWTYQQITDPQFRDSLAVTVKNWTGKEVVEVELADGVIRTSQKQAFLNLYWWPMLTAFDLPICIRHFVTHRPFNRTSMAKAWNIYYDEIMHKDFHNAKKLKKVEWDVLWHLYKFSSVELQPWIATLDIFDLAKIVTDKSFTPLIEARDKIKPEMGTDNIEKYLGNLKKDLKKILNSKDTIPGNALYPYIHTDLTNFKQLSQTLLAFGVRTDVNDNIVNLPIKSSALGGFNDIQEFAVESLSAKKALFYSHVAVAESQYFGRKQHLLASTIKHIYSRDCGSKAYVAFDVTPENYANIEGVNILDQTTGKLVKVTKETAKNYINTRVYMRSPMTCKFRNGVCEVCGGAIFENINRKINIGILSSIHVIEPTTQKILSAKHLTDTNSLVYELPAQTAKILCRNAVNEIRWLPIITKKLQGLKMGIHPHDFIGMNDVGLLRENKTNHKEERLSSIHAFTLKDASGRTKPYFLAGPESAQVPYFSAEMLLYIRDHRAECENKDGLFWIPLDGTEKFPIFKVIVINDNMLQFVSSVSSFLAGPIKEYTSCSAALQEFSNRIHSKVEANITHLATLLKAYMVSSPSDFRIPLVTDPDNVMFRTTASILNSRSIGPKMGYQMLYQYVTDPATYLTPKQANVFDGFVGYI